MKIKQIFLAALVIFLLTGCPGVDDNPPTSTPQPSKIGIVVWVNYDDTFEEDISINVLKDPVIFSDYSGFMGSKISTAEVTINNIAIPFDENWGFTEDGTLITLTVGEDYTIKVVVDGLIFEETITMPPAPNITSHVNGDAADEANPISVTWDPATTTHTDNLFEIFPFDVVDDEFYTEILPAATLSHTIPAGTIKSDLSYPFGARIMLKTRTIITNSNADFDSDSYILFSYEERVSLDTSI